MIDKLICTSHAKINWWLKVGPARSDGFHELETVFQELDLGEVMGFRRNNSNLLVLSGFPADIVSEHNLVTRSWNLMRDIFPGKVEGVDVEITKSLPRGGGLGGGSSNAACAIVAINDLFGLEASAERLEEIGAKIGSDVAFFVRGGTAIGRGRGEILERQAPPPRYWLVLVQPNEPMSTAEGYRLLDSLERPPRDSGEEPNTLSAFLTKLYSGSPQSVAQIMVNDFELVAERFNWFKNARQKLLAAGALNVFLCGSGSTVAGIVTDQFTGQRVADDVEGILTSTRCTP